MMRTELSRQLLHLSGLLFIILAQFIEKEITIVYFFILALFFLLYSEYIKREEKKLSNILNRLENRFRDFTLKFERREHLGNPFQGAFWFYLSCAVTLFIFPFHIASAACSMLAVGDSFSTLFGIKFGRHSIRKNKSLEGSLACFLGSLAVGLFFVNPVLALAGAASAAFAELSAGINDNLTIPVFSGGVMFLFSLI
jgi:glycerol-3-phosphate acyltransferase PlsY